MSLPLLALGAYLLHRMTGNDKIPTTPGVRRPNVPGEQRRAVTSAIASLGWPDAEVDAAIWIESGWRTDARNPLTDASGLIQLMPAWFARHAFRADLETGRERAAAFRALNAIEQLPWLLEYFGEVGRSWSLPGDTYLAFAAPAYVGSPDDTVIFSVGGKAWKQNPAWRSEGNGPITAGSIRAVLLRRLGARNV